MDDCDQCDIHAISVEGACRCRIGYKGDAFECEKSESMHGNLICFYSVAQRYCECEIVSAYQLKPNSLYFLAFESLKTEILQFTPLLFV